MDSTITNWLDSLAAQTPTPGGGAVAALSAAIAAAQLGMVAAYTTGVKWQDREEQMKEFVEETTALRSQALELMQADAEAFSKVGAAYQLPKDSPERAEAIQQALAQAADPPSKVARLAARVVEVAEDLATSGNPNVISDVAVGASMAKASLESAIVNIQINEKSLKNTEVKSTLKAAVAQAEKAIKSADAVIKTVKEQLA